MGKLNRVLDDILDAHVILTREKHRHVAEIIVKSRFATLTAKAVGGEFQDSAGICVDRLLAQARKHRGRLQARRRGRGPWTSPRRRIPEAGEAEVMEEAPPVVRMGRLPVKAMSVDEALIEAQEDSRPIVVFRNSESKELAVIFRRPDGKFGLVETEA